MKRLSSLLAALALVLGVTALVGPANADPYPGTVATTTRVNPDNVTKRKRLVDVTFSVRANGNAAPRGTVELKVFRQGELIRTFTRSYNGGVDRTTIGRYKKAGRYAVRAVYSAPNGSVFKDSKSAKASFRVKR